ncbi:MAG: sigma-70 family RNA polymerase sigma factor [Planctomycetes bacterium]|nr:sigma-70 family RNA polymerase sigma factor [Planctomycetota bacterium]
MPPASDRAISRDTTLIRKCLDGELDAYGELVDRHGARLVNLAYMMVGNRHDAEDIAQDAFIRAYKGLDRFQMRAKFSSWLYQITLNLCKDHLKARSRRARKVGESYLETLDDGRRDATPRAILESELSEKMREAIGSLPYLYREAFVLRHLQGLEYDEIASITGMPADTVRVRTHRARELMRRRLAPVVDTYWREKAMKEKGRGD